MTDTAIKLAHPLDPATGAEYLAGRQILAAAGLLAESVRFAYYGLEEPPKHDVLGAVSADRRLRAFLIDVATGESADVVVSLGQQKVISRRVLDPLVDGQVPILDQDFAVTEEVVRADPAWQAAMARRGLTDVTKIRTCPLTAGSFGDRLTSSGAGWCGCWRSSRPTSTTTPGRTRSTGWPPTST